MVYQGSKQNKANERRFLLSGLFILGFLGYGVLADLSHPVVKANRASIDRNPASISKGLANDTESSKWIKNEILNWDCKISDHKFLTTGLRVRISGNLCAGWKGRQIELVNEANGVTGTMFLSESKFTTDFLHLQSGSNLIKAHSIDEGEALGFEFTINMIESVSK